MNLSDYVDALVSSGLTSDEAQRVARLRAAQKPPSPEPARFRLEKSDDGDEAELYLYGAIGFSWDGEGMTPKMLVDALAQLGPVSRLNVRINSPGGDAFDGLAMANILQRQPCTVAVSIDALAASAATIVAMAASKGELTIAENAMAMVHRAWGVTVGNKNDMAEMGAILEKIDGQIAATYAARSGRQAATWLKLMEAETWMTATEAVEQKFADKVVSANRAAASVDPAALAAFRNVPAAWLDQVQAAHASHGDHKGHFVDQCSCGAVLAQCRCLAKDKERRIVQDGCQSCQDKRKVAVRLRKLELDEVA